MAPQMAAAGCTHTLTATALGLVMSVCSIVSLHLDNDPLRAGRELNGDGRLAFEGSYVEGLRDGPGVLYFYSSLPHVIRRIGRDASLAGSWSAGTLSSSGVYTFSDGSSLRCVSL